MKKVCSNFSIIALVVIVLVACENNDSKPTPNNIFQIDIENGADYASQIDEVEFYIVKESGQGISLCRVPYNNGKLEITFPDTIAEKYLDNINANIGDAPQSLTISDPTAMIGLIACKLYKDGYEVETLRLEHTHEDQTIHPDMGQFVYSTKPTIIAYTESDAMVDVTINLELKVGYNMLFM